MWNADRVEGVGMRLLACWDRGFESRPGRGCLSGVNVFFMWRSRLRPLHSCRGVLPSVVCLNKITEPHKGGGLGPLGAVEPWKNKVLCSRPG
jgi:hypothetical protein